MKFFSEINAPVYIRIVKFLYIANFKSRVCVEL